MIAVSGFFLPVVSLCFICMLMSGNNSSLRIIGTACIISLFEEVIKAYFLFIKISFLLFPPVVLRMRRNNSWLNITDADRDHFRTTSY